MLGNHEMKLEFDQFSFVRPIQLAGALASDDGYLGCSSENLLAHPLFAHPQPRLCTVFKAYCQKVVRQVRDQSAPSYKVCDIPYQVCSCVPPRATWPPCFGNNDIHSPLAITLAEASVHGAHHIPPMLVLPRPSSTALEKTSKVDAKTDSTVSRRRAGSGSRQKNKKPARANPTFLLKV